MYPFLTTGVAAVLSTVVGVLVSAIREKDGTNPRGDASSDDDTLSLLQRIANTMFEALGMHPPYSVLRTPEAIDVLVDRLRKTATDATEATEALAHELRERAQAISAAEEQLSLLEARKQAATERLEALEKVPPQAINAFGRGDGIADEEK